MLLKALSILEIIQYDVWTIFHLKKNLDWKISIFHLGDLGVGIISFAEDISTQSIFNVVSFLTEIYLFPF